MFFIRSIWSKYGKSVILPTIIIVVASLYFFLQTKQSSPETIQLTTIAEPIVNSEQQNPQQQQQTPDTVVVDVKGAVQYPGVYSFTTENRIIDAIQAAGGYTDKADPKLINHAQRLTDELTIYIPEIGEEVEQVVTTTTGTGNVASQEGVVNINIASEAELMSLPGIGPSKAAAIISYREENGGFATVEDLKSVSGIGDKTFEKLQPLITVK